ncbi:MAG TPA: Uma2 family endonuclease [Thermomicrobiales bacterium]|jgi:Uma2 family endonuclease
MVATRILTAEDLEAMGEEGERYEIVRGELREVQGMGIRHGASGGRLQWYLSTFVYERDLGEVLNSDTRYVFPGDPPSTLAPDISFVRGDRWAPGELPDGYGRVVPDFVAEFKSPSNTEREMRERVAIYLEAGVPLVVLARPTPRTVSVFRADGSEQLLTEDDELAGDPVLPGFRIRVSEIFRRRGVPSQ